MRPLAVTHHTLVSALGAGRGAQLIRISAYGVNLSGARLVGARLERSQLLGCALGGAELEGLRCEAGSRLEG